MVAQKLARSCHAAGILPPRRSTTGTCLRPKAARRTARLRALLGTMAKRKMRNFGSRWSPILIGGLATTFALSGCGSENSVGSAAQGQSTTTESTGSTGSAASTSSGSSTGSASGSSSVAGTGSTSGTGSDSTTGSTSSSPGSTGSSGSTSGAGSTSGSGSAGSTAGTATLQWQAPTENTDGTPLTNLAGYEIHYGTTSLQYTSTIQVSNTATTTYAVQNLPADTYYFT